jgi:hypothetical protein
MRKVMITGVVILMTAAGFYPSWAQTTAKPDTQSMIEKMKEKHLHKGKPRRRKISGTVQKPRALPTPLR